MVDYEETEGAGEDAEGVGVRGGERAEILECCAARFQAGACPEIGDLLGVPSSIGVADHLLVGDTNLHAGHGAGEIAILFVGQTQVPPSQGFLAAIAVVDC